MNPNPAVPNLLQSLAPKSTVNPLTIGQKTTTPYVISGLQQPSVTNPVVGVKATQPATISNPNTNTLSSKQTAPATQQTATGSLGSYKGVPITSGSNVAQQMAQIDAQQSRPQTLVTGGGSGTFGIYPPAVTGNATTPSGAVVNATTGGTVSTPQAPSPTFSGLVGGLSTFNPLSNPQVQSAYQSAQDINKQLEQSKANEANAMATNRLNPIPIGDQTGREAVIRQQYETQQAALASQLQGQSTLFSAGLTGTGQQLQGQTAAANLAQPNPTAFGQTVFNPLQGNFNGASGGLPPEVMQQYAQMAANGQYSAIPSSITSNPVLSAQLNQAAQQINPNYNPIASTAQGQVQASNIQTGGTAGVQAANTGYQQSVNDYANMSATNNSAEAQINQVKNVLSQTGINQGVPAYNAAINTLQTQLGGTAYTQLVTSITELQNMYSQLLSSGGTTPTGSEQQAVALLNPSSSAAQIQASIQQLQVAAYNRLSAQYGKVQQFQSNLGGINTQNATTGATNSNIYSW